MATIYAVRWTTGSGRTAEWHFGNAEVAEQTAAHLAQGWRKDARAEKVEEG